MFGFAACVCVCKTKGEFSVNAYFEDNILNTKRNASLHLGAVLSSWEWKTICAICDFLVHGSEGL